MPRLTTKPSDRAAQAGRPVTNEYHVYDPRIRKLLDVNVTERDGKRTIRLTSAQAQYFIDQGAIGTKPYGELGDRNKNLLSQMTRGRGVPQEDRPKAKPAQAEQLTKAPPPRKNI